MEKDLVKDRSSVVKTWGTRDSMERLIQKQKPKAGLRGHGAKSHPGRLADMDEFGRKRNRNKI